MAEVFNWQLFVNWNAISGSGVDPQDPYVISDDESDEMDSDTEREYYSAPSPGWQDDQYEEDEIDLNVSD